MKDIAEKSRNDSLPAEFQRKSRFSQKNVEKIFFETDENGNKIKRNWIYIKDNIFFCSVCLCFGTNNSDILSSSGYDYNQPRSQTFQILRKHEVSSDHKKLMRIHLDRESEETSMNRKIVEAILKSLIYLTTHGEFKIL